MYYRTLFGLVIVIAAAALVLGSADRSASAQDACTFTGTLDTLVLYHAPLTDPAQHKDDLPGGVAFPVIKQSGEHFYIQVDDAYAGWVDRRSGRLNGDCAAVPVDDTSLTDYDTLCFFSSAGMPPLYMESALVTPQGTAQANTPYVVTLQAANTYYLRLNHAFGAWVAAVEGDLSGGGCEGVPPEYVSRQATILANARLWSKPDVQTGAQVADLAEGTAVMVIAGPVHGPIRFDTADQGDWYQVRRASDGLIGWVWADRLIFE